MATGRRNVSPAGREQEKRALHNLKLKIINMEISNYYNGNKIRKEKCSDTCMAVSSVAVRRPFDDSTPPPQYSNILAYNCDRVIFY